MGFFFMVRPGLWVFRRKFTEVGCHSQHVISRVHTISMTYTADVNLNNLAGAVLVGFLHWEATPFHYRVSGRKTLFTAHN